MTSRRRIVHLIDGLEIGGAEMTLYRLVTRMDPQRLDNRVVSMLAGGHVQNLLLQAGIPVTTLDMHRGRPTPAGLRRWLVFLRQTRPHVVQTWMYNANLLGALTVWPARETRLLWNIRSSSYLPDGAGWLTRWTRQGCRLCSAIPDVVVVNSRSGMQDHSACGYQSRRWEVVPNGFDTDAFRPSAVHRTAVRAELGLLPETPLIGIVGRLHPVKDHATFIRAACRLSAIRPEVHYLLVGSGVTPDNPLLASLLREAPATLHLLGERQDIPRLLAALDICALTSLGEGFPNVIGEAMSCGTPCVVTDTSGDAPSLVDTTGLVVPARQPEALAIAWQGLLTEDGALRQRRAHDARARICRHYSMDGMVKQYDQLYDTVCRPVRDDSLVGKESI